jgi:bifunctional diaminopimelate decarboxylase / aspartate kinase
VSRNDIFKNVEWIDIGGGLGIGLDLISLRDALLPISTLLAKYVQPPVQMKMEPGRFIVADAGVLLTRVTQIKRKAGRVFVGVSTGMNSLIRPALYSATHNIHNLSLLDQNQAIEGTNGETNQHASMLCDIVGPICESADVLGSERELPSNTSPADILLIEHGGAYGHCMSSHYNLRMPAVEVLVDSSTF